MSLELITDALKFDDFTPLEQHQERTPGSFFLGKPVLHLQCPNSKLRMDVQDLASQQTFAQLYSQGATDGADNEKEVSGTDVWVTSRYLALWSHAASKGVKIPYPAITVHAQDGDAVLLELNLSDSNNTADEDIVHLQLRIVPASIEGQTNGQSNGHGNTSPSYLLYKAIGDCQELNPDPPGMDGEDGEDDGFDGFDETAPGATGWITSENMHEFVDEDGNFRIPEGVTTYGDEERAEDGAAGGLGQGAGTTRTAAELDGQDGLEDENKWQRTG